MYTCDAVERKMYRWKREWSPNWSLVEHLNKLYLRNKLKKKSLVSRSVMWQVGGRAWPRFIILWHLYLHTVAVIHSRLLTARHTNNNTIQGPSSFMCRWGVMHWFRSGVPTSPTDKAPPHSHLLITETCCWLLCHFFQMMFSWFKKLDYYKISSPVNCCEAFTYGITPLVSYSKTKM